MSWDNSWGDVKMTKKRGVVAQLIYMLVLIAIAVVVGLFFMNIVEKNKKNAANNAISQVQFSVLKDADNVVIVRTPQDPKNFEFNLSVGDVKTTFNKSVMTYNGMYYQYKNDTLKCDNDSYLVKITDKKTGRQLFFQAKCKELPTE